MKEDTELFQLSCVCSLWLDGKDLSLLIFDNFFIYAHFQLLNTFPIELEHCVKNEKIEENVLFRLVKTPGKNSNRNNVSGDETSKKSAGGRNLPFGCHFPTIPLILPFCTSPLSLSLADVCLSKMNKRI